MQRLVYSPKAFIFIKRRNGDVADVSQYCTAGSVTRRVNAVSEAKFSLRNPNMIFTASGGQHAAFFPMDPVTIYLQRLHQRPVRVFTGYLDDTPYYELYPGVIEFTASCTLKKLLYTYFDPALPYTQNFLADYGWIVQGDGTAINPAALKGLESDKDGGMGSLLYATLNQIGGWNKKNIKIEALPKGIVTRMGNMIRNFENDNASARAELELLIQRFVGSGDYGQSGQDTSGVDVSKYDGNVAEVVYQVSKALNASVKLMLSAFETGIVESGMQNLDHGDGTSLGWRQETASSYPGVDRRDVNASVKRYITEGQNIMAGKTAGKAGTGMYQDSWSAGRLAQAIQGSAYPDRYDQKRAEATSLMEKTKAKVDTKNAKTPAQQQAADSYTQATRRDGRTNKGTGKDAENRAKLSANVDVHGASPGLQVILLLAQSYHLQITAGKSDHSATTSSGNISDHSKGWAIDVSNGSSPTPEMDAFNKFVHDNMAPIIKQLIWRNKDQFNGYPISDHMNHVHVALKQEYAISKERTLNAVVDALAGRSIDTPATPSTDPAASTDGILPQVRATALAATLNWSSIEETVEAKALQGNKSLMNDKPLMPYIQQMTEGSLRQFMSMPNGDFFAFYPDYFGETFHRPPYWIIDDIEVLDGKVRLSDAALVTHEYAIGDTFFSGAGSLQSKLFTAGSISILNAFQSGLVTTDANRKKDSKNKDERKLFHAFNRILTQDEAVQFLERYGARPDVQEFPFIRNPFFEMFMAYQRFMQAWSRQFLSPFKLTFMPELYPGGKVGFPEHGLQMYVEEVTHTWDYESGFVTEADLSSPAAMMDAKGNPLSNNLPPNMPTALLEVAAEKALATPSDVNVSITPGANGQLRPN